LAKVLLIIISVLVVLTLFIYGISSIANVVFNIKVNKEVALLFENGNDSAVKQIIKEKDLEGLPGCVQKWLRYAQVVGKERITFVRSKQTARLRTKEGQPWMTANTKAYYSVTQPGFIWQAKIKAAPLVHIAGRDKYYQARGNMLIKPLSLFTAADASGKEIDQGSLLRYLAESVWFPTAALNNYITWEEINSNSATATMSYQGVTASGVFTFNEKGEVVSFLAERYMESQGKFSLETWFIPLSHYQEFDGYKIPTRGEAIWKLDTGDFKWYQFELIDIEYNIPAIY